MTDEQRKINVVTKQKRSDGSMADERSEKEVFKNI